MLTAGAISLGAMPGPSPWVQVVMSCEKYILILKKINKKNKKIKLKKLKLHEWFKRYSNVKFWLGKQVEFTRGWT